MFEFGDALIQSFKPRALLVVARHLKKVPLAWHQSHFNLNTRCHVECLDNQLRKIQKKSCLPHKSN